MPAKENKPAGKNRHDKNQEETRHSKGKNHLVVAIGASAGGLDALKQFFEPFRSAENMAFAVIQHLSPDRQSHMGEILGRTTSLPVKTIEDGMKADPGHIYCNPPGKEVSLFHGVFHLTDSITPRLRSPIDYFFRSVAGDQDKNGVAVVLSGTGTDGTLGIKEIKARGGMVMAQEPGQAQYGGMPQSAIETGMVDHVLPVGKMADLLNEYARHPYLAGPKPAGGEDPSLEEQVQKILMLIRSRTGNDFTQYKQSSIHRRIERRMAVNRIDQMSQYIRYVQENPAEVEKLLQELLIRVSSFFRDKDAFESISGEVFPELFAAKEPYSPFRIWVPGCSTGEEAYSLAIILTEAMERLQKEFKVQIFASDLDRDAIQYARAGTYPASIRQDVTEDRLKRFFSKDEETYIVNREIREIAVFAVQNLVSDPPFSRLDLISCRNLLIYLGPKLQKKIMPLFHYVLNPGGFLFLGSSESVGEFPDLFVTVNSKARLFRRKDAFSEKPPWYPPPYAFEARIWDQQQEERPGRELNISQTAEHLILSEFTPPCVIVNEQWDVVFSRGQIERYLSLPSGKPNLNVVNMAREGFRYHLKKTLLQAGEQRKQVIAEELLLEAGGTRVIFDLVAKPVRVPAVSQNLTLLVFQERKPSKKVLEERQESPGKEEDDPRLSALRLELESTKTDLQGMVAELQAANEELQSANEEAQSMNEELDTSREELKATNEELSTVNTELQMKIDELSRSYDDLSNFLASTDIGTVFLDMDLKVKRFTPPAKRVLSLIDSDLGRPIVDIKSSIPSIDLNKTAHEVRDTLHPVQIESQAEDDAWYSVRIRPYRTAADSIGGVVITFVDVSELKRSEEARIYAESIIDTLREAILVLDKKLNVKMANAAFYRRFMTSPKETLNRCIYELGNHQWDIPRLRELLEEVIPRNQLFDDFALSQDFAEIGHKKLLLNGRMIRQEGEHRRLILLAIEDVTDRKSAAGKD